MAANEKLLIATPSSVTMKDKSFAKIFVKGRSLNGFGGILNSFYVTLDNIETFFAIFIIILTSLCF